MTSINWGQFLNDYLPVRLRTAEVKVLFESFMQSVNWLYTQFVNYRTTVSYKLAHTSQVWSIEAVLNDEFDTIERRIYLLDSGGDNALMLQLDSDQMPVNLDTDTYSNLLVHTDSSYFYSAYDFIIVLPYTFLQSDVYRLKALTDAYKLAGKRYDIIVIPQ
jgi:hypothetical protein